jgi:hypothetical protein
MNSLRARVTPIAASVAKSLVTASMLLVPFCVTTVFFHGAPALLEPTVLTSDLEIGFSVVVFLGYLYLLGSRLPPGFWRDGGSPAEIDAAFREAERENRDRAEGGWWSAAAPAGREAYDAKKAEREHTAVNS